MIQIPFVWTGNIEELRGLNPGPSHRWGKWQATEVGDVVLGVIEATGHTVREHAHPCMTFLPSSGHRKLSDEHIAKLSGAKISVGKGDTLADALEKIHAENSAAFLNPDRF